MSEYNKEANDAIHSEISKSLTRIEAQTVATNGKVRFLEKMVWLACGGLSVLTFFFAQDRLLLSESADSITADEIAKELIDLQAATDKLKVDEGIPIIEP